MAEKKELKNEVKNQQSNLATFQFDLLLIFFYDRQTFGVTDRKITGYHRHNNLHAIKETCMTFLLATKSRAFTILTK